MVVFEHLDEQGPEDDPVIPRAADDLGPDRAKASVRDQVGLGSPLYAPLRKFYA